MALISKLEAIGNAIRLKTGRSAKLSLDDMVTEINSIQTGTDTSDATAAAADLLTGKTAYVKGSKITGNMPNNGAITGTISTKSAVYNPAKGYHSGSGTVQIASAEQNKIIASNIKKGVSILGVTGTFEGATPEPITPVAGDYPFWGTNSNDTYAGSTMTKLGETFTVPKTGSYRVKAYFMRAATSGEWAADVYRNGTATGKSSQWTSYKGSLIADVDAIAGETLEIYARSRGASYAVHLLGWYVSIDTPLGEL